MFMIDVNRFPSYMMFLLLFILALSFALGSCNNGESTSTDMSTAESAAAGEISETEEKMGTFTFAIEEEKNAFSHLPAEKNMTTPSPPCCWQKLTPAPLRNSRLS